MALLDLALGPSKVFIDGLDGFSMDCTMLGVQQLCSWMPCLQKYGEQTGVWAALVQEACLSPMICRDGFTKAL